MCVSHAGSTYYDNVRPLAYPDSDAVLICFDISRPETLDSVLKKVRWPNTFALLGCGCVGWESGEAILHFGGALDNFLLHNPHFKEGVGMQRYFKIRSELQIVHSDLWNFCSWDVFFLDVKMSKSLVLILVDRCLITCRQMMLFKGYSPQARGGDLKENNYTA